MDVAIYLFTGFLEAGKTKFIKETLADDNFNDGKRRILIMRCEDGEEEFEPLELGENISICSFESADELVPERLSARVKRAGADVVIVEYNGMWQLDSFYSALPENFMVFQEIFIADSTTILSYNANMRQLVVDKLTSAEMVVFNRTDANTDRMALHKLVRGVSRKANICYEDISGEIEFDDIEDPLPYDLGATVVNVKDEDFAIFYRDMSEEFDKYNGKMVSFKGIVALDESLPKGHYAIGRHIMTCCADDIAYRGVVAKGMGALKLKTRDWVTVTGKLSLEYSKLYQSEGPVLTVTSISRSEKPEQEVATF